jgi:flagellar motor component MotA
MKRQDFTAEQISFMDEIKAECDQAIEKNEMFKKYLDMIARLYLDSHSRKTIEWLLDNEIKMNRSTYYKKCANHTFTDADLKHIEDCFYRLQEV